MQARKLRVDINVNAWMIVTLAASTLILTGCESVYTAQGRVTALTDREAPVADAEVILKDARVNRSNTAFTDKDGNYKVTLITAPGTPEFILTIKKGAWENQSYFKGAARVTHDVVLSKKP